MHGLLPRIQHQFLELLLIHRAEARRFIHLQVIGKHYFSAVVDDGLVEQADRVQPPQIKQN